MALKLTKSLLKGPVVFLLILACSRYILKRKSPHLLPTDSSNQSGEKLFGWSMTMSLPPKKLMTLYVLGLACVGHKWVYSKPIDWQVEKQECAILSHNLGHVLSGPGLT